MEIYAKVMQGITRVRIPAKIKGDTTHIITDLLRRDPSDRLPMKDGGTEALKDHVFFQNFDWSALKARTLEPPYKPEVQKQKDLKNFVRKWAESPPHIEYRDDGSGWCEGFATV